MHNLIFKKKIPLLEGTFNDNVNIDLGGHNPFLILQVYTFVYHVVDNGVCLALPF